MTVLRPARGGCPREQLPDYVAGRLDAASARWWDRHLVACGDCSRVVDDERVLRSVLTGTAPRVPGGLRSSLMALDRPADVGPVESGPGSPRFPGVAPLPMVRPGAPPCHRSALRSAVVAAAAAGATAATAWTLSVVGSTAAAAPTELPRPTSPAPPASAAPGGTGRPAVPAALTVSWPVTGTTGTTAPAGRTAGP
ncbi:MAG TPA: zf-HC2 domain-containing protein [Dermatophilaceae bacterium]|nr:zf-HC2 domain-containing protein [Dermatophilaceae bacterium]